MSGNQKYIVGVKFIITKINGSVHVRAVAHSRNIRHWTDHIPRVRLDASMRPLVKSLGPGYGPAGLGTEDHEHNTTHVVEWDL
jgi:hypothetical protein